MHVMPPGQTIPLGPAQGCFTLLTGAPATQMPAQLMPSFVGSHLSDGSSMHFMPPGHIMELGPAQGCFGTLEDLDSEADIFP